MSLFAQPTFPVNGVGDERETTYALKNATIVKNAQQQSVMQPCWYAMAKLLL